MLKKRKNKLNYVIGALAFSILLLTSVELGMQSYANASDGQDEQVLLQKDKEISSIISYKQGMESWTATSKATSLSNMKLETLKAFKNKGFKVYITDDRTEKDQSKAEPVRLDGKTLVVSIHSNSDDMIDAVNKIVG